MIVVKTHLFLLFYLLASSLMSCLLFMFNFFLLFYSYLLLPLLRFTSKHVDELSHTEKTTCHVCVYLEAARGEVNIFKQTKMISAVAFFLLCSWTFRVTLCTLRFLTRRRNTIFKVCGRGLEI